MTVYDRDMPMWMLVAWALAVARLTGFATTDEITRPVREWIVARFDASRRPHRLVVYLVGGADDQADGCPWCVSVWVAAATAPVVYVWHGRPVVAIAVLALAASQTTGMIHSIGRE